MTGNAKEGNFWIGKLRADRLKLERGELDNDSVSARTKQALGAGRFIALNIADGHLELKRKRQTVKAARK